MIKDNLILLRKQYGYSQEKVSEYLEVSRQTYGKWETGDSLPDVEKCVKSEPNASYMSIIWGFI